MIDKSTIRNLHHKTPYFIFNKDVLQKNIEEYNTFLPENTEIYYSMKANAEAVVLENLYTAGVNFEVASKFELRLLHPLGVPPERIIYGSSVKSEDQIKEFVAYGVDRFAADSLPELVKIAKFAPGARVYVRALVDDQADSVFHMSEKFGVYIQEVIKLMIKAKELGLVPYGISFNVGSQARSEYAWGRGIVDVAYAMEELLKHDIKISIINIGGGFPHKYEGFDSVPHISHIAKHIHAAIEKLPYLVNFIAEPGRGLVANTYDLVVSVTEKIERHNGNWLHVDAGVYNALLEAMSYQGSIRYKIEPVTEYSSAEKEQFVITGPTCDDLDVIDKDVLLPSSIQVGDKLLISDTGAYTFTLITPFNGYPRPEVVIR